MSNVVCAYTVDPASLSFDREAGAANPIFRTWPGNDPSAVSEWKTNVVSGVTLKQDTNQNTVISSTKKGVFNVGASLILTATKFGESDVVPLRLAGDTADTSANPLLAPALVAAVRVTSNQTINVTSIDIKSIPEKLSEGSSVQLSYTVLPKNADDKGITWSSDNPAIASVDQAGTIMALAAGSAKITAEAADGSGVNKSFTITVVKNTVSVKSIKITNAPQSLKEGEAFQLSCEVLPEDATNKDLAWSSSNNKVAAVTGQSGEITALLAGEAVITVEARDGSGIRDQFTLTVKKNYLSNPKPERPTVKTDTAALSEPEYYGENEIEELAKAISMDKSLLTAKEDGSVILRQDVVGGALESVKKENPRPLLRERDAGAYHQGSLRFSRERPDYRLWLYGERG
ncbi:MAG: Ig-like domain-containing protein [Synergistaceae bacterium]|nr:Ig-like domain-containing protein [Synergistaceae bacterium]